MDEKTGELLENYSDGLLDDVEVLLTPPRMDETDFDEDFEWPLSEGESTSNKRKYSKKEAAKDIQQKASKKLKKLQSETQLHSFSIKASKPKKRKDSGNLTFYILKSDLDDELNPKPDAFLWRRDGDELLQKFLRLSADEGPEIFFVSTPVYSIWEDHRSSEYQAVEVKPAEPDNDSKVQLVAISIEEEICEENSTVIECSEDSLISFDDGSSDVPMDENCIIIEEIFMNE